MPSRVDYTKYANSDLSILTVREREAFELKLNGLSNKEISEKLNCGIRNAVVLIINAKKRLDANRPSKHRDFSGSEINRIKVLEMTTQKDDFRNTIYKLQCHCGKIFYGTLPSIRSGLTKSCGCLHKGTAASINKLMNQKQYANNTTGYTGVSKIKNSNRFVGEFRLNGKRYYLGTFSNASEAGETVKIAKLKAIQELENKKK